ncbi:siderophore-interacting protein [Saccharopolyspora rhizosphaerae]|uniref:Siderophore-interacting protein n=1 Tax=Saccharopolyspora rhizosphaerae TaxID=2492662 RepID=A0A426K5I5_9PSEU|nr:siderophore-interacting protein [Saccharopolyspora rhizosphaerae]RRO20663.1 siderophore-interacting protein [Saccharopolyspora rhizosphaerae]
MATCLTVTSAEMVTSRVRRLWFRSDDLSAFADSVHTDRYVKLVFPKEGVTYPEPLDVKAMRGTVPAEDMPTVRTFTALFPDVERGTMAIDFVMHGDQGVAGPWAARAEPGDRLIVNGPGGAYRPDPEADWHLLAGDEAALPAISAALRAMPADAVVRVVLLVDSPAEAPELPLPQDGEVDFIYRSDVGEDGALEKAVRELEWLPGRVHAFVHGEAHEVMRRVRPYLFRERGVAREQASISGYWRRGRDEEAFREWKAEFAKSEGAAR